MWRDNGEKLHRNKETRSDWKHELWLRNKDKNMSKHNPVKLQKNNGKEKNTNLKLQKGKSIYNWMTARCTENFSSETVLARKKEKISEWTNNL